MVNSLWHHPEMTEAPFPCFPLSSPFLVSARDLLAEMWCCLATTDGCLSQGCLGSPCQVTVTSATLPTGGRRSCCPRCHLPSVPILCPSTWPPRRYNKGGRQHLLILKSVEHAGNTISQFIPKPSRLCDNITQTWSVLMPDEGPCAQ